MVEFTQWNGFKGTKWKQEINVRDFIQKNYTPYDGDESLIVFLNSLMCFNNSISFGLLINSK